MLGLLPALVAALGLVGAALDPVWYLVGLAGFGLAAVVLPRPERAALPLLFLLYTRVSDLHALDANLVSLNQLGTALLLTAVVSERLIARRRGLVLDRTLLLMVAYAGTIALSALGAQDRGATLVTTWSFLHDLLIVVVLINLVRTTNGLRSAAWTLVVAATMLAVVGWIGIATGQGLGGLAEQEVGGLLKVQVDGVAVSQRGARLAGPVGDSNYFAQMLVVAVPLALERVWSTRPTALRWAAFGALVLIGQAIVLTLSRGGLLGLLAVLGFAAALQWRQPRRLLTIALAVVLIALAAPPAAYSRVGAVGRFAELLAGRDARDGVPRAATNAALVDEAVPERFDLWRVGLLMIAEHPLAGIGGGNYLLVYPAYYPRVAPWLPNRARYAHSTPIQIAAETGLLGLAAFSATLLSALAGLRQARRTLTAAGRSAEVPLLDAVALGIGGYVVTGLFLTPDVFQRCLWLLVALAIAARRVALGTAPAATKAVSHAAMR